MISPSVTTFLPLLSVRDRTGDDDLQAVVTRLMTALAALRRVTTALQTGEFSIGTSGEDYFGTHNIDVIVALAHLLALPRNIGLAMCACRGAVLQHLVRVLG